MRIAVPTVVNAAGLIPFLGLLSSVPEFESEIAIDFSALRRVSPAGLVALMALVARWQNQRTRRVVFTGLQQCAICGYLQRMDVLHSFGVSLREQFTRHESKGRFVPLQRILDVDLMSRDVAACLAPGGDDYGHSLSPLYDLVAYVIGELGANVRQHSNGIGFVCAQSSASEGLVRLAVADNGRGIRQSFVDAGLNWSFGMSDSAAIEKALEPRISSRGKPINEGVGLTLVSHLARLASAWLLIVSGTGLVRMNPEGDIVQGVIPGGSLFRGTLVALTFRRDKLQDFATLLHYAKQQAGLLVDRKIKSPFA